MKKSLFVTALKHSLKKHYGKSEFGIHGWANNAELLDRFVRYVWMTMLSKRNYVSLNSKAMKEAWEAVGGKGEITYRGLKSLGGSKA